MWENTEVFQASEKKKEIQDEIAFFFFFGGGGGGLQIYDNFEVLPHNCVGEENAPGHSPWGHIVPAKGRTKSGRLEDEMCWFA